jgi:epoxyqueuosine reductase
MKVPASGPEVKALAADLGFPFAAFTAIHPAAEDAAFLERWVAEGKAAGMGWLSREPARRGNPANLLAGARTLISLGVPYAGETLPPRPAEPVGRVARYAWGLDYHGTIQDRLEKFRGELVRRYGPDVAARPAVDIEPLLERAFARRAGLGFVGKNTNLIRPGAGSFLFLADLLVNLELPPDPPVPQGCGECRRCAEACPTGALNTDYSLDARLCIAYHTIENRGPIDRRLRARIGEWLFGCDLCQDACPYNARALDAQWPEFRPDRGPGAWISLREVLSLRTSEAFKKKFAGTSLLRAKRAGLVRNACLVAANGGWARELMPELTDVLNRDADPVARGHAAWALRSGGAAARRALDHAGRVETDATVRDEIASALEAAA